MKKALSFLFAGIFLFSFISLTSADLTESTALTATVNPAEISFSVPESIDFGDITQGYNSEEIMFAVLNTGETDIRVEAILPEEYPENGLFRNLKFKKEGTVTARTLSSFYLTIDKPEADEENVVQNAFIWLDLTKYTEIMSEPVDAETDLIFTAMPN